VSQIGSFGLLPIKKITIKIVVNQHFTSYFKKTRQLCVVVAIFCLSACETTPPVQEMSDARQAIAVAKEAGAADRAAFHLRAAEKYLASAEQNLGEHAYSLARRDAKQAKMKALDAIDAIEKSGD
jgi:hypothetical protein